MLLRTRITLMVFLVSLTLIVTLALEGSWKTQRVRDEMDLERIQGQKNAWIALVHNALQPLDLLARTAGRNGSLTAALAANDRTQLTPIIKALQADSGNLSTEITIEIATLEGKQMFGAESGDTLLSQGVITAAGRHAVPIAGLFYTQSGLPVLAVVAPLYSRSGLIGVIGVMVDPQPTVKELAAATGVDAVLSNASGGFPSASKGTLPLEKIIAANAPDNGVFTLENDGRRIQITRTTVATAVEGAPSLLHGVADITESARHDFWLATISLTGIISGVALALAFLDWYLRRSFRPLYHVIQMLDALARGERSTVSIASGGNDEIGRLAETAIDFRKGLDARDQLLKLRQDIDAAHNIQKSILPDTPPDHPDFVVKTYMHPARDVGGDFYDFFDLPDGRFGFVIADVSGKGMGAALFMAVACTVIRSTARLVPDPGECLTRVNDLLAANNAQSMFVTAFYGVYTPTTGQIIYANGGHNPPYRLCSDRQLSPLPRTKGKLLALFPGKPYATAVTTLAPGDCLYLFTDGVTEAQNGAGELFGEDRLENALTDSESKAENILDDVLKHVTRFVDDAPQADDITCMSLLRKRPTTN